MRCPFCGAAVSLTQGGTALLRHLSPRAPRYAPRADRVCEGSGMPLDEARKRAAPAYEPGDAP